MTIGAITSSAAQNSGSQRDLTGLSENLNNFLTLLTTQLQNQDPLSPLDTHEFTNQLVMFADVEQSITQSRHLEDLIALQKSNEVTGAVSYIGKTVEADHNEFNKPADGGGTVTYNLPEDVASGALQIFNKDGDLVHVSQVEKDKGKHSFTWDGKDVNGDQFPAGVYSFQVNAVNKNDQPVEGITYRTTGKITGVEYGSGDTVLVMGGVQFGLGKVSAVVDGS